ncbi:MAG: hypothetical protein AB7H90_10735 [Alphaproteobacteria bacterium]
MRVWTGRRRHDPAAGLGDLEAALTQEFCPICAGTAGADERWLDRFLDDGYLERSVMRRIAAAGGFCAFHAVRMAAIGQSATVALVYLSLIADCLPRFTGRRDHRGRPIPPFPLAEACEVCAQQREIERRECFFLALLIQTHGPRCYGAPALVCMRHLPLLLDYLDERNIGDILARHRAALAVLDPEETPDPIIRLLLGPPLRLPTLPAPPPDRDGADIPDPVRRMRHRLRDLPSCAICTEIADAGAEWLDWLARASENGGEISDVLPLCREHAWQVRDIAGPVVAPALAGIVLREAGQRLAFAAEAASVYGGSRRFFDRLGRALGAAPARRVVLASLRRGRECPLCARIGEAGERALALVAALVESGDGRRAFENGYGLCVRHAARAMAMPEAPPLPEIAAQTIRARLALLRWELEEQLRRGAWQARPQRRGVESAAWLRAGARFAGTL